MSYAQKPKPELGPPCDSCGLLSARAQEACYRLMNYCNQKPKEVVTC